MKKISTLFYTIKQGFKNIFRNKLFSLASIATISSCLFLFGLFYSVIVKILINDLLEKKLMRLWLRNGML